MALKPVIIFLNLPYIREVEKKSFTVDEIREKMAAYCVYQDRCYFEIEQKLNTFFLIPEARDEILLYLMRENFVNEERFARSFARGKFYQKHWGRVKIRQELKKRNINERLIQSAMEEISDTDYHETAEKLIAKKSPTLKDKNPFVKKQKIIRFMLQKGFEYDVILPFMEDL